MNFERLKASLLGVIEATFGRRLLYHAPYQGTVIAQSAGQVEVRLDDERMRGQGMSIVQVRHGMAGVLQTLAKGQRIVVMFDGGDPDKPFVFAFDRGDGTTGVSVTQINASTSVGLGNAATLGVARLGDDVDCGALAWNPAVPDLQYKPPGGVFAPVATLPGGTDIEGVIDSASAKVLAE